MESNAALDTSLVSPGVFKSLFPEHGQGGETVGLITKAVKFNRHG